MCVSHKLSTDDCGGERAIPHQLKQPYPVNTKITIEEVELFLVLKDIKETFLIWESNLYIYTRMSIEISDS